MESEKLIIAFVGLPARGKSYLSRKLAKFLNWLGFNSKVFSVGIYRRKLFGNYDCNFFDFDNKDYLIVHEKCIVRAIDDLVEFINSDGKVGIFDATNTKPEYRRFVEEYCKKKMGEIKHSLIWIESICELDKVIEQNILKTKLKSPDYKEWNPEKAVEDFRERIRHYEKCYVNLSAEVDGENTSYIQLKNHGSEIVCRHIIGYVPSKILSYLMNLNLSEKPIYLTRHGQSLFNIKNIIGGDSGLSELGIKYSKALKSFMGREKESSEKFTIYSSTLKRTLQTTEQIKHLGQHIILKCLDEIDAGICENMTYEEVEKEYPQEYEERAKDKLRYRYPRGESYQDLINRIEPIIYELERREGPVIIVGHQAILRCLYGYFVMAPLHKVPTLEIPLHTVIKLIPEAYVFNEKRYTIDPETDSVVRNEEFARFEDQLNSVPK
jgi:6-phosphofructo-2-kinase/fructose-2,6-biphosphatase 2/6-phosphofructo-2-kinase/fructose-2,6-biphosphatase 4